jgi:hypothetical protein
MCNIFDNEPCRNVDQTYSTDIYLISDALELYTEINWKNMADGIFFCQKIHAVLNIFVPFHMKVCFFLLLCS